MIKTTIKKITIKMRVKFLIVIKKVLYLQFQIQNNMLNKKIKKFIINPLRWRLWKHPQRIFCSVEHLTGVLY